METNAVNVVDIVLVVALVATAAFFLAWTMLGRGPKRAPACHNVSAPLESDDVSGAQSTAPSSNVVIGGALARGLDRAAAKRRL